MFIKDREDENNEPKWS